MKKLVRKMRESLVKRLRNSKLMKLFYRGPIKWVNRKIRKVTLPEYVLVRGERFFIDKYDSLNLSIDPDYNSKFFIDFLEKIVKKGNYALNIGANIGYYSVLLSNLVGPNGKVYAFEPAPENFEILNKNASINKHKNIVAINKAVSDKSGKIKLYLAGYNQGDHRIYDSGDNRKFTEVDMADIDSHIKTKIDFALIDTQGADFAVFRGMRNTIKQNPNMKIIIEFSPGLLCEFGESPKAFLSEIKKAGFRIFDINDKEKSIRETTTEDLLSKYTSKEDFTDLFLIR